jgi:hypothetical protein
MKDDKRNGFVLNWGMAWTKPEFAHHQVDHAGDVLIAPPVVEIFREDEIDALNNALDIINNWRSSHSCPLQSMKMTLLWRAKKIDKQSLIAQRIKRIRAIAIKLRRNPNMKLSKMHDIGGCRAVMRSVGLAEELVAYYEKPGMQEKSRFMASWIHY